MPRRSPKAATEITAADRKAAAVELRARGYTFADIALELGYADASGASKAYHAALRERPAQNGVHRDADDPADCLVASIVQGS